MMNSRTGNTTIGIRRRVPQLDGVMEIDPNDIELLRRFVTEQGKILPARFTGATPLQQRKIARAVRRARVMGLLR
jgi:small subunit ribosomal protein S18